MIINPFWTVFFLTWWVGIVLAIYPIYRALMRAAAGNENPAGANGYSSSRNMLDKSRVAAIATGACGLAVTWPLFAPFWLSYTLYNLGRKPDFEREIKEFRADEQAKRQLQQRLKQASIEVEAETTRRDPFARTPSSDQWDRP